MATEIRYTVKRITTVDASDVRIEWYSSSGNFVSAWESRALFKTLTPALAVLWKQRETYESNSHVKVRLVKVTRKAGEVKPKVEVKTAEQRLMEEAS